MDNLALGTNKDQRIFFISYKKKIINIFDWGLSSHFFLSILYTCSKCDFLRLQVVVRILPVNKFIKEDSGIVSSSILVIKVVSMLPDVQSHEGFVALSQRIVSI